MGSSKNLIKDMEKLGWELSRISGSHHIFIRAGFAPVSVPHPRKDLGKGIENKLRKQAGL